MRRTACRPTEAPARPLLYMADALVTAGIYTPGDVTGPARPWAAGTAYSQALNQNAGAPIHTPAVGILVALGVVALLEFRRIKRFAR